MLDWLFGGDKAAGLWDRAKETVTQVAEHAPSPEQVAATQAASMADTLLTTSFNTQSDIDRMLAGKTAAEIEAIKAAYEAKAPGMSFDARFGTDVLRWEPTEINPEEITGAVSQILNAEGISTYDQESMLGALRGKSPAELEAMRAQFLERTGESLDGYLSRAMTGWTGAGAEGDLNEAMAHLSGDPVRGAMAALENACGGGYTGAGTDEQKIMDVLEEMDPRQRERLLAEHGDEVRALIAGELSLSTADKADALLRGDLGEVAAIEADDALNGGWDLGLFNDQKGLEDALARAKTDEERQAFLDAYEARTGIAFTDEADRELDGAEQDLAEGLVTTGLSDEDREAALAAARFQKARGIFWDDKEAMSSAMEVKPKPGESAEDFAARQDARQTAMEGVWEKRYATEGEASFGDALDHAYGAKDELLALAADESLPDEVKQSVQEMLLERERADRLRADGKLSDGFKLKLAGGGVGTREQAFKDAVKGKSKEEMQALAAEILAETGQDWSTFVGSEIGGRDLHDFEMAMAYGDRPATVEDLKAKEAADYEFERGANAGVLSDVIGLVSNKDDRLDAQHAKIQSLGAGDLEAAKKWMSYQQGDIEGWRADVDAVGDTAGTVVTTLGATALTVLSGGVIGPAAAAIIGGLGGMGTKRLFKGAAYDAEAAGFDAAMTAVNAATAGLGQLGSLDDYATGVAAQWAKGKLAQAAIAEGIKGAATGTLSGLGAAVLDEQAWDTGDLSTAFAALGTSVVGNVAGGMSGGAMNAHYGAAAKSLGQAIKQGAVAGTVDTVVSTAVDPAAYSGDLDSLAILVATNGLTNIGSQIGQSVGDYHQAKGKAKPEAPVSPMADEDGGSALDTILDLDDDGAPAPHPDVLRKQHMLDEGMSKSGMGTKVDELVALSPKLTSITDKLAEAGWDIRPGKPGCGGTADRGQKVIQFDPEWRGKPELLTALLAHEGGHAVHQVEPQVPMAGLTKEEYVAQNTARDRRDEGEAFLTQLEVAEELYHATKNEDGSGGIDASAASAEEVGQYLALKAQYPDPKDRDKLREALGALYMKKTTSNTHEPYDVYYGKLYEKQWDAAHGGAPVVDETPVAAMADLDDQDTQQTFRPEELDAALAAIDDPSALLGDGSAEDTVDLGKKIAAGLHDASVDLTPPKQGFAASAKAFFAGLGRRMVDFFGSFFRPKAKPAATVASAFGDDYDYRLEKATDLRAKLMAEDPSLAIDTILDNIRGTENQSLEPETRAMLEAKVPEMKAFLESEAGKSLTNDELVALIGYTGGDYRKLNATLRGKPKDAGDPAKLAGYLDAAKSALAKLPSTSEPTYRGMAMSPARLEEYLAAKASGKVISDPAFSSSSKSPEIAQKFIDDNREAGKIEVMVTVQAHSGKDVGVFSSNPHEQEVLFAPNTGFKIVDMKKVNGTWQVTMAEEEAK